MGNADTLRPSSTVKQIVLTKHLLTLLQVSEQSSAVDMLHSQSMKGGSSWYVYVLASYPVSLRGVRCFISQPKETGTRLVYVLEDTLRMLTTPYA